MMSGAESGSQLSLVGEVRRARTPWEVRMVREAQRRRKLDLDEQLHVVQTTQLTFGMSGSGMQHALPPGYAEASQPSCASALHASHPQLRIDEDSKRNRIGLLQYRQLVPSRGGRPHTVGMRTVVDEGLRPAARGAYEGAIPSNAMSRPPKLTSQRPQRQRTGSAQADSGWPQQRFAKMLTMGDEAVGPSSSAAAPMMMNGARAPRRSLPTYVIPKPL
jgi:hypothetical protein